jgi:hypothetical protein
MDLYWIECANLEKAHSHVTSVVAKRWWNDGSDGGTWEDAATLSLGEVVTMIDNGDEFRTVQKGGGDVLVIHERCSEECTEEILRTRADDSTTDNLDHIPCRGTTQEKASALGSHTRRWKPATA